MGAGPGSAAATSLATLVTEGGMPGLTPGLTGVGSLTGPTRSNGLWPGRKAPWVPGIGTGVSGSIGTVRKFIAREENTCLVSVMPSPPWTRDAGVSAVVERWLA